MRPDAKFHGFHEQSTKGVINGPRPSPLMINKDSHLIRKPSVSSTSVVADTKVHKKQRKPIIIYTQSPKVIHTKAQDFMALVQRLTGRSSSNEDVSAATASQPRQTHYEASENFGSSLSDGSNNSGSIKQHQEQMQWKKLGASDVDETSSALRRDDDETCVKEDANVQYSPTSLMGFADMPLFTPNSSADFFCSSQSVLFKYSDSPYGILGNLISPSGLEFIKELPEY